MQCSSFEQAVEQIVKEDPRYDREAYAFLRDALDFTVKMLKKTEGAQRHVTGRELLEGIRIFALEEFGPVARRVLNTWGIRRTDDFGEMVFHLVNKGVLGKKESDKKDDFADGYDFREAFVRPFLPASKARRFNRQSDTRGVAPRQRQTRGTGRVGNEAAEEA